MSSSSTHPVAQLASSSMSSWTLIASAIWLPTVYTGFSAASASWKTIAIFAPADWSAARFSVRPEQLAAAEADRAGDRSPTSGSRPRIAIDVTLLPEPDSPTMPSVSCSRTSKLTRCRPPDDAVVGRELDPQVADLEHDGAEPDVDCLVDRERCAGRSDVELGLVGSEPPSGRPSSLSASCGLGVERVAQTVTEEVHAQDGDQDHEAREVQQVRLCRLPTLPSAS